MPWSLYRDARDEQRQWSSWHAQEERRKTVRQKMSPEIAARVAAIHKKYPWVTPGLSLGLAASNASDTVVRKAAQAMADQKSSKSRWSRVGDVIGGAAKGIGGVVGDVGGAIGDALPSATSRVGGSGLTPNKQRAGTDPSPVVRSVIRGASALAQSVGEAAMGEVRSTIASGEGPMGGGALGLRSHERNLEVAGQTTLGAALEQQRETGRIDLGHGFFAMGEAQKRQAANSRKVLSVDGSAWTPGRALATTVLEPGSLPYKLLSGTVDAAAAWKLDVPAAGLTELGDVRAAARTLSNLEGEAQVARAAAKADPEWRRAVEEARGAVTGGNRPTVVPRAVEKYMYSDEFKRLSRRIADTKSPTEIWRAFDKKMSPELAYQLARTNDPADVAKAMRPHLGLDVLPEDVGGFGMRTTQNLQRRIRAFNVMPNTWLPFDDPDTFVRNLDNSLANAKVMGEKRDQILDQAFKVLADPTPGRRKQLLDLSARSVRESLMANGVDEATAKSLSSWVNESDRIRHYLVNDAGEDVNLSFLVDDAGNPVKGAKPAALMDALNSGAFLYDPSAVREIRSLTRAAKVLNKTGFQAPLSMVTFAQQELWKLAATARLAYFTRVNSEEAIRSMSSGAFDSAFDYLNFVALGRGRGRATGGLHDSLKEADDIAERLATDALDDDTRSALQRRLGDINEEISRGKSEYQRAKVGRTWKHDTYESMERSMVRSGNWAIVSKEADPWRWSRGMADEAIGMSQDPIIRRVANGGLFSGDDALDARPGLDGIKDWLLKGTGTPFRRQLEDMFPGVDFKNEGVLDEVIEKARLRVEKLGPNDDLREAVATGRLNGEPMFHEVTYGPRSPSKALLDRLAEWAADPASPRMARYEQLAEDVAKGAARDRERFFRYRDRFASVFYGTMYGKTSDYLARSPVFRAEYWNRMEQLIPYLDEASRARVLENAEEWGKLGKNRMQRLVDRAKEPAGETDFRTADDLARGWALDKTGELLFDSAERSQFFDATRAAFPFGEAWKEVLGRWGKLAIDRPQIPRRLEQIVRGARGAGFFHRDEATGEEVFSYPLDGPLADYLGVSMQGSVQGLSLGTSVMPGVGPVGTLAMKEILPNVPETDFIRAVVFPFGEPESVTSAFTPSWLNKVYSAATGDEGARILANSYVEVTRQLAASGKYGSSRTEKTRLLEDAWERARAITAVRGLVQFVAPSAPMISYKVPVKGGVDQVAGLLAKDMGKLIEAENEGEIDSAIGAFLDKYGDNAYAYLVGKTRSTVGGQKASVAYGKWERENSGFIKTYSEIAGYFGPQVEGFDSTVFQRQINAGNRERRSPSELLDDAQATVASWIYENLRKQVPERPSDAQSAWLRAAKEDLIKDYPGWNPDAVPGNLPKRIRLLNEVKSDPKVRDTEIGKALNIYFEKRGQAIEASGGSGLRTLQQANKTAHLRTWLHQVGSDLAEDFPKFRAVWRDVLAYEFKIEEEADA